MSKSGPEHAGAARRAKWPALSEFNYTYASPEEALNSTESAERRARAENDAARIRGTTVTDIVWSPREVAFVTSRDSVLRVYLRDSFTEWNVVPISSYRAPRDAYPRDAAQIELEMLGKGTTYRAFISPAILRRRIGATITDLWACNVWFHVYCAGMDCLCFFAVELESTGGLVLRWIEDD